jgi:hypothetical protein
MMRNLFFIALLFCGLKKYLNAERSKPKLTVGKVGFIVFTYNTMQFSISTNAVIKGEDQKKNKTVH